VLGQFEHESKGVFPGTHFEIEPSDNIADFFPEALDGDNNATPDCNALHVPKLAGNAVGMQPSISTTIPALPL